MPVGELLADKVDAILRVLHVQRPMSVKEIGAALDPPVTARAVRYAVLMLVDAGKAKLVGPKLGMKMKGGGNRQRYKVLAVVHD